ncbi:phage tail protein, partial [Gottfriedia acidiceleris]
MAQKIQIRRGLKANLPLLDVGEFGFTTDTNELFIGSSNGN